MRALSLWQPWAALVLSGAKTLETRSWRFPRAVLGKPLLIHAAKTDRGIREVQLADNEFTRAIEEAVGMSCARMYHELPFGKVVALCEVGECQDAEAALAKHPDQYHFGDFTENRYAVELVGARAVEFFDWRGSQKFFEVADEMVKVKDS